VKISILISLYKPNVEYLRELLESVVLSFNASDRCMQYCIRCRFDYEDCIDSQILSLLDSFNVELDNNVKERLGFANSFISMVQNCDHTSDLIFLCDQDDVWLKEKISRTIDKFSSDDSSEQLLLSNSIIWSNGESSCHTSPRSYYKFFNEFKNKKIHAVLGPLQFFYGHNMVISGSFGKDLSSLIADRKISIYSHDRFLFYLANIKDCKVILDDMPLVLYRQHKDQVIGAHFSGGLFARASKKFKLLKQTSFDLIAVLKLLKSPYHHYFYLLSSNMHSFIFRHTK